MKLIKKEKREYASKKHRRVAKSKTGRGKFGVNKTNTLKYTKEDFQKAIKDSLGVKYTVYQRVGCHWATLNEYFAMYPELDRQLQDEKKTADSFVNNKMMELIEKGDSKMITLYQKTKGGYREQVVLDHKTSDGSLHPRRKLDKREMETFKEVFNEEF